MPIPQSRSHVFTLNFKNTSPEDRGLFSLEDDFPKARYVCYQLEMGEEGTLHYQGYVEWSEPVRGGHCVMCVPGAHWEKRQGTREEARDYAMKPENLCKTDKWLDDTSRVDGPWELGTWEAGGSGKRTDLSELHTDLQQGMRGRALWDAHFTSMIRYHRGAAEYIREVERLPPSDAPFEVHVYWGVLTGMGKSFNAARENPGAYPLPVQTDKNHVWFEGYRGQSTIIVNEFYGWIAWAKLLSMLDGTPDLRVEIKGTSVPLTARKWVFTSNKHPGNWYKPEKLPNGLWDPLRRRITEVREYRGPIQGQYYKYSGPNWWETEKLVQMRGYAHCFHCHNTWDGNAQCQCNLD